MPKKTYSELRPPERLLLGAGPSNIDPRVSKALVAPIVEHLDPYFMEVMDETVELLRYAFKTKNHITMPISGTGSAGMESAICNLVEKGDSAVVCVNGFFGGRMKEMVQRCGGSRLGQTHKQRSRRRGFVRIRRRSRYDRSCRNLHRRPPTFKRNLEGHA
jgi:alanine-glyoxylate transaminase/serine-glyoxylate transaminase/serine-pyruvate transaminase